eukprot:CAMPEP_0197863770 /NCGR_PEP_ID=MMETSP1438-20131217/41473_1 /TAXON_ID=1461541 /ORGANISM="Pterosperma sp., Strain CCMP1384" /LENGTH=271 /DNA_ID=CAMNT_0043481787 /DNA_START=125 /DNA_END=937 /DNA_ORIENTATION=-
MARPMSLIFREVARAGRLSVPPVPARLPFSQLSHIRSFAAVPGEGQKVGWLDSLREKVGLGGKGKDQSVEQSQAALAAELDKPFTIDTYVGQIEKAASMGNMAGYLPAGLSATTDQVQAATAIYNRQIKILKALTEEEKTRPDKLTSIERQRISSETGVQITEVRDAVDKYLWMQRAMTGMKRMKDQGLPLPTDMAGLAKAAGGQFKPQPKATGVKQKRKKFARAPPPPPPPGGYNFVSKSSNTPSRGQPCPCGSGKKYKACCWKIDFPDW